MGTVTVEREDSPLLKTLNNLKSGSVKVGWFPSARYDDEKSTPVAAVAAQNEYGNPNLNIPERPFLRPAVAHNEKKWSAIGKRGLNAVLAGQSKVPDVLDLLGVTMREDIRHSIAQVYEPVLQPATIEARLERGTHSGRLTKNQALGITKPLIDTSHMYDTVSFEIDGGV